MYYTAGLSRQISKVDGSIIWKRRGRTRRGNAIVLEFVILVAAMRSRKLMLAAEILFAMLAFKRQEIDEAAVLSGTLVSDREESGRRCRSRSHG